MKNWMTFAFTWGTIALLFTDPVKAEQPEMDGVCSVLNALTPEGKALSRFNAMVFGDFIAGKNANIMGPLAVKGTFTGENALINSKKTTSCALSEDEFEHQGLVLMGANASPITVHGYASLPHNEMDPKVTNPLEACASQNQVELDFDKIHQSAMEMSRKLAGMLPNWSIDADGVIVNMLSEGIETDQPFNLFSMPACTMGACKAINYFDCGNNEDCEAPAHMLSSVDTMFLGKGEWAGPVEEPYPQSEMVVFNIPVLDQHTFDIQSENPSMGLNACNTLYNFYAVDEEGKYKPEGRFTIKRSTTNPLAGMVLAPQAHILDDTKGSFSGQVIAASYEALGDNITIKDYISSGNNNQCQTFQGCLTSAEDLPEEEASPLEESKHNGIHDEILNENEEPWDNVNQKAEDETNDDGDEGEGGDNDDEKEEEEEDDDDENDDDDDEDEDNDNDNASSGADNAASSDADEDAGSSAANEDSGSSAADEDAGFSVADEDAGSSVADEDGENKSQDNSSDSVDLEESSADADEPEESSDGKNHYRWNKHRNSHKGHGHHGGNWDGHWND